MKIVILAGGSGTRLWPVSRKLLPKQFTSILGDKVLLQETIDRFTSVYDMDDIYISINQDNLSLLQEMMPDFDSEHLIIEPEKRDTGPAMGFAAVVLSLKFPDEPMVFIPSDHYIGNVKKYLRCFKVAEELINKEGKMMDIAITANFPSVVLGYTQIGEKYLEQDDVEVYHFQGHTEKPDFDTAKKYLADGSYLWHGNYYMWTPAKFLAAYEKYSPDLFGGLMAVKSAVESGDEQKLKAEYFKLQKISIDYAITEKMDPSDVLIIKGDFGWSDIGAWDVYYDMLSGQIDQNKNLVKANWVGVDTSGTFIYGPKGKVIATIGLDDMVIIDTEDALLVCPQSRSQDVKEIVAKIEKDEKNKKVL